MKYKFGPKTLKCEEYFKKNRTLQEKKKFFLENEITLQEWLIISKVLNINFSVKNIFKEEK